jgi:hypothetical protein
LELAEDVWSKQWFFWDVPLTLAIHLAGRPWLDTLMNLITLSGESIAVAIVVVLAIWFWRKRRSHDSVTVLASFGGGMVLSTLSKSVFARPRPTPLRR